jgi:hypothetical protein
MMMAAVKVKQPHNKPMETQGERMYSSYSFTTSAADGGEWSASHPGRALAPGKGRPVPIVQVAGSAPEPVWTQRLEKKILLPLPGIEPRSPGRPVRSQTMEAVAPLKRLPISARIQFATSQKTVIFVLVVMR